MQGLFNRVLRYQDKSFDDALKYLEYVITMIGIS